MRYLNTLVLAAATASALFIADPIHDQAVLDEVIDGQVERFHIELSPGDTRWVTEDEKWALRRAGQKFFDITATGHTYPHAWDIRSTVQYPAESAHNETIKKLAKKLNKDNMRKHLETFTAFHTRYYKSETGIQSAKWLLGQVNDTVHASGADKHGATVKKFDHPWGQFSIIATIPGKSEKTVVVGAHQDSINLFLPSILAAPGADDDGSGTVTILETLRTLLESKDIVKGKAENTIEFHWYSAEEGGLLGSQAIFSSYHSNNRDIKAMLQQDMTGYVAKTIENGKPESVGVITDFVDPNLTAFIKRTVATYCDIPFVETKCGYACSDHASASKYGYPSAFVIESSFEDSNKRIHTTEDKIGLLSFDHMLQHAKFTLGYAYELAFAKF